MESPELHPNIIPAFNVKVTVKGREVIDPDLVRQEVIDDALAFMDEYDDDLRSLASR